MTMARPASLVSFCTDLKSRLPTSRDSAALEALETDLATHLRGAGGLSQKSHPSVKKHAADLDRGGTELWNLCTKLRRELDGSGDGSEGGVVGARKRLLSRCRYLAFLMIDIASRSLGEDRVGVVVADTVHLVRLALKAARACVDVGELGVSLEALQRASDYIEEIKGKGKSGDGGVGALVQKLEVEYFILRTVQAWKEDRLDVPEHMFRKAGDMLTTLDPSSAENLADTFLDIGRAFLPRKEFQMAVKWLQRAYEIIDGQDIEKLSRDGVELRLTILQSYIQGLLGTKTQENLKKAEDCVAYVETELGDTPVLLLLRLELLQSVPDEEFDPLAYENVLHRMVKSFNFTEEHFKFMLHHARWLYQRSATLGCSVMDDLIATRILPSEKGGWVEKALVLRVFMATSQSAIVENCIELSDLLARAKEVLRSPIQPAAAAAAQSLLWKQVEATLRDEHFELTDHWCRLVMHEVFHPAGQPNLIKAARKRIYCAMMRNEFDRAKALYLEMSEPARNEPMSKYLMFKVATRSDDQSLASECLEALSRPSLGGHEFLHACILDAQSVGSKRFAVVAMKALIGGYDVENSASIHLPAMIRCTIRLQVMELNADKGGECPDRDEIVKDICQMFETASEAIKKVPRDEKGHKLFTVQELNWFSSNSYTLGRQHFETWGIKNTIRIFTACLSILGQYPADIPSDDAKDISLKIMCCHFIIVAALVSIARTEDALEEQQGRYAEMRRHVASFDGEFQGRMESLDADILEDLLGKLATLLIFDFEAAVALREWDHLLEIVTKAAACEDAVAYKAMADCLLRASEAPGRVVFSTMRAIINRLSSLEDMGVEKLAGYIRCLFQIVLPLEGGLMAFQLVDEALQLVRESMTTEQRFPDEELEWLATMSWNHAIDLYEVGKDEECKKWSMKAINLAHYCQDEGRLEKLLQGNLTTLRWEAK